MIDPNERLETLLRDMGSDIPAPRRLTLRGGGLKLVWEINTLYIAIKLRNEFATFKIVARDSQSVWKEGDSVQGGLAQSMRRLILKAVDRENSCTNG